MPTVIYKVPILQQNNCKFFAHPLWCTPKGIEIGPQRDKLTVISSWTSAFCLIHFPHSFRDSISNENMALTDDLPASAAHSEVTLELAKKESAEHMHGMKQAYDELGKRPLLVKAYALDDPKAPSPSLSNGIRTKTVHFVRHGQGFHNLMADLAHAQGKEWEQFKDTPENPYLIPEILDAPLTEKGRQQAYVLQAKINGMELGQKPQLVVFSPNCRALQTGVIVFESLVGKVPFVAHEMAREESGIHVCDKRRPVSRQRTEFPQVNFGLLEAADDPLFQDDVRETRQQVADRVYQFFEWLATQDEQIVAVSSHSGWLLTVFNAMLRCDESLRGWFQTGEMRSVQLEFLRRDERV
jgi:broad specificity phosphatase PhoE